MAFDFPTIEDPANPGFDQIISYSAVEWDVNRSAHGSVGIILGSKNDWAKVIACGQMLETLGIKAEVVIGSAHRTPEFMAEYSSSARERGIEVIIAAAGGSAHLQAMSAAFSHSTPVFGVGVLSPSFGPNDVLGSNVRLPSFSPVAFVGFDKAGAINAALMAANILALADQDLGARVDDFMTMVRKSVLEDRAFNNKT